MAGQEDSGQTSGRGGEWVVAQFVVLPFVFVAVLIPPDWPDPVRVALTVVGVLFAVAGARVVWSAARAMGRGLTPFPEPPAEARLIEHGPFRYVRHPTYAGALLFLTGWSLFAGPVALALTALLAALWIGKLRSEEIRLRARFPEYGAYAGRVRYRLVPRVY